MDRAEQGARRQGKVTGSIIGSILSAGTGTLPAIAQRIRLSGAESFAEENNAAPLAWGRDHEDAAAGAFWMAHPELELTNPKYLDHHDPDSDWWLFTGGSPDRIVMDVDREIGHLEIKCPFVGANHLAYKMAGVVPAIYRPQVHFYMWLRDLPQAWFLSYDPRSKWPMFEVNVPRDRAWDSKIEQGLLRIKPFLLGEAA